MRNRFLLRRPIMALSMGTAFAADLPSRKDAPVYVEPAFSWTGFYLGAHVGGDFGNSTWTDSAGNLLGASFGTINQDKLRTSGFIYGGQVGYNYEFASKFLLGVEGELWGSTLSGSHYVAAKASSARSTFCWRHRPTRRLRLRPRAAVRQGRLCVRRSLRYTVDYGNGYGTRRRRRRAASSRPRPRRRAQRSLGSVKLEYDYIGYGSRSAAWYITAASISTRRSSPTTKISSRSA